MSTSPSYSSKIVSYNKVTHVDDFSLQQFMKTPFVGSTERWERPKMGCRRVIDSGCSDTMISRATVENYDCDTDTAKINVEFANGASATSIGTAETTVAINIKLEAMVFENGVLSADLISVSQIVNEQNCDVLFTPMKVTAYNRSTKEKLEVQTTNNLYHLALPWGWGTGWQNFQVLLHTPIFYILHTVYVISM